MEVLSRAPGTTWESAWGNRVEGELLGVPTHFAGVDDLIAMKAAVGRKDKDLPDLERLRRLREGAPLK